MVLEAIADLCRATKRQTDVLARIGGEEFVMLLPETDEAAAEIAAERLPSTIEQAKDILRGEHLKVTVSIGVAEGTLSMSSFEVMLKCADAAMYETKLSGRNRVLRASRNLVPLKLAAAAE